MPSWLDGQPAEHIPLSSRGLAYGDGLFETIGVKHGRPRFLARHLERLAEGARRLHIAADIELIREELLAFAQVLEYGVCKLLLVRGEGARGYAADATVPPRRILQGSTMPAYPAEHAELGVHIFPCVTRLAEQPLLAGLKHLNRLEQVLARAEWQDRQHAEGLLLDQSGRVIEGVFSNVFIVTEGLLRTADLSRCGVVGVMRAELLEQARQLGLQVSIEDLLLDDVQNADEMFFCNSLYGVWPVRSFGTRSWPLGPITRKLQGIAHTLLDA